MDTNDTYEVLENAGLFNEMKVETFSSYAQAKAYVKEMYSPQEQVELSIDITCNGSTEY